MAPAPLNNSVITSPDDSSYAEPVPPGPQVVLGFRDGTAAALDPDAPVARALQAAASHMRASTL
jgi:hypothetical protein